MEKTSHNPLICYSLRKRPDWVSFASAALHGSIRWKEARLDTHDAALPIPGPVGQSRRILRAIFLSPSDVGTDDCQNRIQRLFHLNGGQDVVIVFLLKQEEDKVSPMSAFMTLQLSLGEFEMPVIPVNSVQMVPNSLMAFHRQISTSSGPRRMASPAQTLLPYCSYGPRLSEHAVNVLTDITSDMRDLLDMMTIPDGRTKIIDLLEDESEGAISFWEKEYMVD
ncbi:uncharacterized protein GGS22DRAFT_183395 [Annulohypoxylon maeteangense]|uniref:uncharacterized protein n=1 Tax=Annulohypoxylon maeteangense TaxID=1927788 RepID=UPI0020076ADA|nr:uncharacterized protein GGS22DRAFT_183395 [Annulohypoxylon maeteangense]KAI0890045.1 hypothetical protein GGS22DRAFT_183395 [Annulohypoxylon maeteangense]